MRSPARWFRSCAAAVGLIAAASCAASGWRRIEREDAAMGTRFRVVLYARDRAQGEAAAGAALRRVHELDAKLSDYRDDSALSRLCAASAQTAPTERVELDEDLYGVLACADGISFVTGGAFDVTIGRASELWRRARRQNELPTTAQIEDALRATGWEKLELDAETRTARLLAADMRLDAGGIGKGFAVDQALEVLAALGIDRALVAGGGDVGVRRAPPGERGWQIAVAPFGDAERPLVVELENKAVSTSGDVYRGFELDGRRYSHVIDPRTCRALTDRRAATVIADDATRADALATAACVLEPTDALALARRVAGVEVRVVRQLAGGDEVNASPGFERHILRSTANAPAFELEVQP